MPVIASTHPPFISELVFYCLFSRSTRCYPPRQNLLLPIWDRAPVLHRAHTSSRIFHSDVKYYRRGCMCPPSSVFLCAETLRRMFETLSAHPDRDLSTEHAIPIATLSRPGFSSDSRNNAHPIISRKSTKFSIEKPCKFSVRIRRLRSSLILRKFAIVSATRQEILVH